MARGRRFIKGHGHNSATASFTGLVPLAEEPGIVTQLFNRYELDELIRLQREEGEGRDGVVVVRFSLADIVDVLHSSPLSPPQEERDLAFEAWARAFEAAACRLRYSKPRPPALTEGRMRDRGRRKKRGG